MTLPSSDSDPKSSPQSADVLGWIVVGAIGVAMLSLAVVHAPLRIKLPLVLPLALGAVAGWGLGSWAAARNVARRGLVTLSAVGLIAVGLVGASVESYRLGVKPLRDEFIRRRNEQPPLLDRIEEAARADAEKSSDGEAKEEIERSRRARQRALEREERLLTFRGYLENRIPPQWGHWPVPWPEVFWGAEVVAASTLGGWLARRSVRKEALPLSAGRQEPSG